MIDPFERLAMARESYEQASYMLACVRRVAWEDEVHSYERLVCERLNDLWEAQAFYYTHLANAYGHKASVDITPLRRIA